MEKTKALHTPEPWIVKTCDYLILIRNPEDGTEVVVTPQRFISHQLSTAPTPTDKANAAHIVACVNALDGMDPEHLKGALYFATQALMRPEHPHAEQRRLSALDALEGLRMRDPHWNEKHIAGYGTGKPLYDDPL